MIIAFGRVRKSKSLNPGDAEWKVVKLETCNQIEK